MILTVILHLKVKSPGWHVGVTHNGGKEITGRKDYCIPGKTCGNWLNKLLMIEQVVPHFGYPIHHLFFTEHEHLRAKITQDLWIQSLCWKCDAVYLQVQSASANLKWVNSHRSRHSLSSITISQDQWVPRQRFAHRQKEQQPCPGMETLPQSPGSFVSISN